MARILIVDDSLIMRKNLRDILIEAGHKVAGEVSNGKQALKIYKKVNPDLITMDITMPIMDGIEASKLIVDDNPEAKIIIVSALDQKRKVFEALKNGAKHYIFKPITKEKVLKIVDEVLITEGIGQVEESKVTCQKDHEVNYYPSPFNIKNDKGNFVININKNINTNNFEALKLAINGFLFIKPLKITFDFNELKSIDIDVLNELNNVIENIKGVGGEFEAIGNNSFIDFAKENNSMLFWNTRHI